MTSRQALPASLWLVRWGWVRLNHVPPSCRAVLLCVEQTPSQVTAEETQEETLPHGSHFPEHTGPWERSLSSLLV